MRYFDTHAHYNDERFANEVIGGADAILKEIFAGDVRYIMNMGTTPASSKAVCEQAAKYDGMYAAVGIHPEDCLSMTDVDSELDKIKDLLEDRNTLKIKAVGEIGLDYYWDTEHKDLQKYIFDAQLSLSEKYGLPVSIHDREAHGDCFEMILKHPSARGVLHSFSGSPELALEYVKRGWYISFSGVVSFKNARKTRETAAVIPHDRILIETDCPYLAPEPFRGKLNRSDYLKFTMKAVSDAAGTDEIELSEMVFENSLNLFVI